MLWEYHLCSILIFWEGVAILHFFEGHWPMHEIQVQAFQSQVGQSFPAGCFNVLRLGISAPEFAYNKHLTSGAVSLVEGCLEAGSNLSFIGVQWSAINVSIANLE